MMKKDSFLALLNGIERRRCGNHGGNHVNGKKMKSWIAQVRKKLGLSRREFARLLGVSLETVVSWEVRGVTPQPPTLGLIAWMDRRAKGVAGAFVIDARGS